MEKRAQLIIWSMGMDVEGVDCSGREVTIL